MRPMTDHTARVLPFNDRSIAAAPYYGSGREAEYRIEGNPGLILAVIRPNRKGQSKRTWRVQYSLMKGGRQVKRKLWLGRYPAVCLADARAEVSKIMLAVDRGEDPIAQAKATKADEDRNALTFRDLAEEYVADQRQAGVAKTSDIERALRRDAFPTLAAKRPSEITDIDIEKVVDAVAARGSRSMARHLLTYLRALFNHALRGSPQLRHKYGLVFNPTDPVGRGRRGRPGKYGRPVARDRVLNDGEIVAFWHAVEVSQMVPSTKVIF
jgi:Arm DNA-binding domain